ncbi:MAG TPA: gfo/Idh/MocA family oxidoreductase [Clostridiaceae bacterium]|nr:gfo/Idh/MocA family oxidoreductase [Clostridiaceae bacterium]
MKICIVGSSGHYGYVLNGLDKDSYIAGIAPGPENMDMDSLYKAVEAKGFSPKRFSDFRDMFDAIKPDIAVAACYFGNNDKVSIEALRRGINVFTEKPVSTTFEGLELLKKEYKKSNVCFVAMFGIRYSPWFLTAHKAVEDGAVGSVRLLNAQKSYKLGLRNEGYKKRSTYGGTIPWVGSHAIDWVRWFSGEKFESVYASHSTMYNNNYGDLELTALCHFTMSNEVFASVSIDYLRPGSADTHGDDRIRVVGTKGIVEVMHNRAYLLSDNAGGYRELELMPEGSIFKDFLKEVRGEGKCMVSAEDSLYITEACLKARQSADEKRVVYF